MPTTDCLCPLCDRVVPASDVDAGNRARIYCVSCSDYEITMAGLRYIRDASPDPRELLKGKARNAPPGSILVIAKDSRGNERFESRTSKRDTVAPDWLAKPPVCD